MQLLPLLPVLQVGAHNIDAVFMALLQIRRYVYCDVVRVMDISPYVDTTGVQVCLLNILYT